MTLTQELVAADMTENYLTEKIHTNFSLMIVSIFLQKNAQCLFFIVF